MKKTLRSLLLAAGIASATVLAGGLAFADATAPAPAPQYAGHHGHGCFKGKHHGGKRLFRMLSRKLALTDQQKAQAKELWQQHRAQAKPLLTDLRTQRQQLRQMVLSGSADESAIRAQSAKVASVQADLAVERAKGAKEFMALLTPDQQAKLKTMEAKWAERMNKRFGAMPER